MMTTPEGVPLRIELADPGERFASFAVDFFFTLLLTAAFEVIALLALNSSMARASMAAALFMNFVSRNGYFIWFELRHGGVTPGKRILGLRVIDRRGGGLTPHAIVARNLTREVEFFFPLTMLLASQAWMRQSWEIFPVAVWLGLMVTLPLANRDRLRAGDLVAGTIVIAVPSHVLLKDLAAQPTAARFTEQHLRHYGVYELQWLEDVLRRPHTPETDRLMQQIAERIQRKIGWRGRVAPRETGEFLSDFYAAQRAFLERRKNLGEEIPDKHHTPGTRHTFKDRRHKP